MTLSVKTSTSTWSLGRVLWANSAGWKPWKFGYRCSAPGAWQIFYRAAPTVVVAPTSARVPYSISRVGANFVWTPTGPSPSVTATASGGVGPYTYSWAITASPTFWGVNSPGSATTSFTGATVVGQAPDPGVATVTVTDSSTGLQSTANVTVSS